MKKTTIKFKLRPSGKENEGILTLYITRKRTTRTVSTGLKIKRREWDERLERVVVDTGDDKRRKTELARIDKQIRRLRADALREVERLSIRGDFTADEASESYRIRIQSGSFEKYLLAKADELERTGHYGNARCYRSAFNSLKAFCKGRVLHFNDITASLIGRYEQSLLEKGKAPNTASCYLRALRAVYNRAIGEGLAACQKTHPFTKVYTGNARTRKRSASKAEMKALARNEPATEMNRGLRLCRDLFLFSFYTQGMPYADMVRLKRNNLRGDYLVYKRQKTGQEIRVRLLPCMREIIGRYAGRGERAYLFPVLSGRTTGKDEWKEYANGLTQYNRGLKRLAARLGLKLCLTGYVARHTWATLAAAEGVPISTISRGMGHESERTTQRYIKRLDDKDVDRANLKALGFLIGKTGRECESVRVW